MTRMIQRQRLGHQDATFTCSAPGSSRRKFLHQREGLERQGVALGVDEVARGSLGAAVTFVLTANRLRRKTSQNQKNHQMSRFTRKNDTNALNMFSFSNTVKMYQSQNLIL